MSDFIRDGQGHGNLAGVDSGNRLLTSTVSQPMLLQQIETSKTAYIWDFTGYDYDAADTVMFLQNTSSYMLHINHIYLYSDTSTKVQIHSQNSTTTPAGTSITGSNINRQAADIAEATAIQDETALSQGTVLLTEYITANAPITILKERGFEILLAKNDIIAVDLVTAGTMCYGHIVGYFNN